MLPLTPEHGSYTKERCQLRGMRAVTWLLLAAAGAVVSPAAGATTVDGHGPWRGRTGLAAAGGGGRTGPALALSVDPFFERDAVPGQVLSGTVRVRNRGRAAALVRVEVGDYGQDRAGRPRVSPPGTLPLGAGLWVEAAPRFFLLAPGRERTVPLRIRVPEDAATASFGAAVFFSAEPAVAPPLGSGTRVTGRLGTLVLVRVQGSAPAREDGAIAGVSFPRVALSYPVSFSIRYRNTGNVHSRAGGELSLMPLTGGAAVREELARRRVLPGAEAVFQGRLESGPALSAYRVRARAVGEDGRTLGRPVDAGVMAVVSWQLPAGLLLVSAGTLALASLRRRWTPPGRAAPVA